MIGSYGTIIPIHINSNEISSLVDISYAYHEKRTYDSLDSVEFKHLDSNILTLANREMNNTDADAYLEGMYNIQLPMNEFNKRGFYTVYIKPKEIETTITDVGSLTAYPSVRGLILDTANIPDSIIQTKARNNGDLVGFRVIYLDDEGRRLGHYRIITSNNMCEPMVQAPNSSSDKSYTYRYSETSSLSFITLSPSSAPTFKANALPYIGKPTQRILLVNTLFEPVTLDIELTSHDADTISYMLENNQLRNLDEGLVTTYNDNNEIYHQTEHSTLKDSATGRPIYELKQKRTDNITFSETIEDKLS